MTVRRDFSTSVGRGFSRAAASSHSGNWSSTSRGNGRHSAFKRYSVWSSGKIRSSLNNVTDAQTMLAGQRLALQQALFDYQIGRSHLLEAVGQ